MRKGEFFKIRRYLGKTQNQIGQLLGISPKTIQSFEQGFRRIPSHVERQVLFLLWKKSVHEGHMEPCWELKRCEEMRKVRCPAWEFRSGDLCWFINGTFCDGEVQKSWRKKMTKCRKCEVFRSAFPADLSDQKTSPKKR